MKVAGCMLVCLLLLPDVKQKEKTFFFHLSTTKSFTKNITLNIVMTVARTHTTTGEKNDECCFDS
jgi:hypothetical protein